MKTPRSDDFIRELQKLFKEELAPILHNLFRKQKRKGHFPTHYYSGSKDKDKKIRKLQTNISHGYEHKNP